MSPEQQLALEQVERVVAQGNAIEILNIHLPTKETFSLKIELSIFCGDMEKVAGGLPLRERERVTILVGPAFPYSPPSVTVGHRRFAGYPHVNWAFLLCLYQAPQTEWSPRNGMFGLLSRLELWFRLAAVDQLDATGGPLHPPVAYGESGPMMIARCNAPVRDGELWIGHADLHQKSSDRIDIVGWTKDAPSSELVAAAILLDKPMPLEFPSKLGQLFKCLEERGVPLDHALAAIRSTMIHNGKDAPLYFVVGTPMRGTRDGELCQHLTGWKAESFVTEVAELESQIFDTEQSARDLGIQELEDSSSQLRAKVVDLLKRWAETADVKWCRMREDRSEVTTRRDTGRPAAAFEGMTVEVWGCGALGGFIAEWIVRAGVRKIMLRDEGIISPGILVRQPYTDADIGCKKADVLSNRLRAISPDCEIESSTGDILQSPLGDDCFGREPDLVIDATASNIVLTKMEEVWRRFPEHRTAVASVAIDRNAERMLCVLARPEHSGGPYDVIRRMKLEACRDAGLRSYLEAFFPDPLPPPFQPEPGCSDATFIGSAADSAALSAAAVNIIAQMLLEKCDATASGCFLNAGGIGCGELRRFVRNFESDVVIHDPSSGFETRIESNAWRSLNAWRKSSEHRRGSEVETGGLLFGEMDEHLKTIWVSEASGPPPDSEHSAEEFLCGIEGTVELNEEKCRRTRKSVQYVGTWHTHPVTEATPSIRDFAAMNQLLTQSPNPTEQLLLLIVGFAQSNAEMSAGVFSRAEFEAAQRTGILARSVQHSPAPTDDVAMERDVGIALSGGGSRAIAFHLGCLRALHERGILSKTQVVSTVSGGSVIGAMYAYSDDSFEDFELRVRAVLRRGLVGALTRRTLFSPRLLQIAGTKLTSGVVANLTFAARFLLGIGERIIPKTSRAGGTYSQRLQPPFRRWVTRTNAFEQALRDMLYGDKRVSDERRDDLDVVINACELRTGTAFRFGSRESGTWRYGGIVENAVEVATAVAASAAFPALLPAIDRYFEFTKNNETKQGRVILTDGGVYENLGVTCMTPGRDPRFSLNTYSPRNIICCDAGPGQFGDTAMPYGWGTRMVRSFETTHRQVQHGLQKQLHLQKKHGELDGFVYSYLGQQDSRLPYLPTDLTRREEVIDYPTDFSPMSETDIELLSSRGEQLTRLLTEHYCPEL